MNDYYKHLYPSYLSHHGIVGQNGRRFSSVQEMSDTYGADVSQGFSSFRLDNCEPNWDAMSQDSVIRIADSSNKVKNRWNDRLVDTW